MCASIGITIAHCNTLQHAATHYNTLQHTRSGCLHQLELQYHTASHCNTLQHTTTHCNTLEVDVRMKLNRNYDESCRSEADRQVFSVLQCVAVCCSVLSCVAVCCSALQCATFLLQYAAVRCSFLQCAIVCCTADPRPTARISYPMRKQHYKHTDIQYESVGTG